MQNKSQTFKILGIMVTSILIGLVLLLTSIILDNSSVGPKAQVLVALINQLGIGALVAGAIGVVFEFLGRKNILWDATTKLSDDFERMETKQGELLDNLESRVGRIGEEIVMTSGMLKNATAVGIEAVYNGRENAWHEDVGNAIRESQETIRIAGISLADLCGFWGGKSLPHESMEVVMTKPDGVKIQILFSDPDGEGLRTRAKFEHPGMRFEETRAYNQTIAKIKETLQITEKPRGDKKVEIHLYKDTPVCFLIITEHRAFVEYYTYASRGGTNVLLAIKKNTALYRLCEDHFEALWKESEPPPEKYIASSEFALDS